MVKTGTVVQGIAIDQTPRFASGGLYNVTRLLIKLSLCFSSITNYLLPLFGTDIEIAKLILNNHVISLYILTSQLSRYRRDKKAHQY